MRVAFYQALLIVAVQAVRLNDPIKATPCDCQPAPTPAADAIEALTGDPENHACKWQVVPAKTGPTMVNLNAQVETEDDAAAAPKSKPCDCQPPPTPAADALEILNADPENHACKWQVAPAKTGPTMVTLNA